MIIQILGPTGSGKSSAVRQLIASKESHPLPDGREKCCGYSLEMNPRVYVLGSYEGQRVGAESFRTKREIVYSIKAMALCGSVVFEGVELSPKDYSTLVECGNFVFAFLDTPLDDCLANSGAWQIAEKDFIRREFDRHLRLQKEFLEIGVDVRTLSHHCPASQILAWISSQQLQGIQATSDRQLTAQPA